MPDRNTFLRLAYHRIDGEVIGRLFMAGDGTAPPVLCGFICVPAAAVTDFLDAISARHFVELQSEGEVR
jgi:hypothetical protein